MPTKIKHLAIVSERAKEMCDFYEAVFGVTMEEGRAIFTDGYVGFNMLTRRNGNFAAINHFGFAIDSLKEVEERLHDLYPKVEVIKRPNTRPFAGYGTHDPEGNAFDLSPADMNRGGLYTELQDNPNQRHISHFTLNAMDPAGLAKFYKDVFGFHELTKQSGDPRFYLSDGFVTMVLAPWKLSDFKGGINYKPMIDHLGWEVESLSRFLDDVEKISKERPELAPKPYRGEHELQRELLAQCSLGRYQLADPEGVMLDVIERAG